MRVGEKLLLRDYFRDTRFQDKIPDMGGDGQESKAGDNIYDMKPCVAGARSTGTGGTPPSSGW